MLAVERLQSYDILAHIVDYRARFDPNGRCEVIVQFVPLLNERGRNRAHFPCAVFQARYAAAGLTKMFKVQQVQQLEKLDLAERARVVGEIENRLYELFSIAAF